MRYNFPPTKFVRENIEYQQIYHVKSEFIELQEELCVSQLANDAKTPLSAKEEAMDLYHSLETLFRIWEKQGVDIEAVKQKVFKKNRERGYYTTCNLCEGEGRFFGHQCEECDGTGIKQTVGGK